MSAPVHVCLQASVRVQYLNLCVHVFFFLVRERAGVHGCVRVCVRACAFFACCARMKELVRGCASASACVHAREGS